MKKLALILTFIMLMLSMSVSANALSQKIIVEDGAVDYSPFNSSITVNGKIEGAKTNTYVLMKIYPDGQPTNVYAASSVYTVGETFSFDVSLPDDLLAVDCTVEISSLYNDEKTQIPAAFYYIGKQTAKDLIVAIDSKTSATEIDAFLLEKADSVNLNHRNLGFLDYDVYKDISSKNMALADVIAQVFPVDTDEKLEESWGKLLTLLKKGTYAALLKDTNSDSKIKEIVENEELATLLELPLKNADGTFNAYDKSKASTKGILYEMLLKAEYNAVSELPSVFKSMAAVAYLRGENSSEKTIKDVFASVNDLKAVDYKDYKKLDYIDKDKVITDVVNYAKNALSIEKVIEKFEELADERNDGDSGSGGSLGGSIGGGSTGGIAIAPSVSLGETLVEKVTFTDLADAFWAESAILALTDKGIINGMGDGKFAPNNNITRAQICKIAVIAFGIKQGEMKVEFNDVAEGAWYKQYVDILSSNGIINGYGSGSFNPNGAVTREELAVILNRAAAFKNAKPLKTRLYHGFKDEYSINDYALQSIKDMYEYGVLNGDGEYVRPKSLATRAETAQLVHLMILE